MDEMLLVAVPVALVAGAAALVKPVRHRIMPVAKAVGRAGVGVAEVTAAGAVGIVDAAVHGEARQPETPSGGAQTTSATKSAGRTRRTTSKASSGRARRRPPSSATG
jgi:hypothetical protein